MIDDPIRLTGGAHNSFSKGVSGLLEPEWKYRLFTYRSGISPDV